MAGSPFGEERLEPVDGFGQEEDNKACSAGQCFAPGYHFYKMVWLFVICSFLGCAFETAYTLIRYHYFALRVGVIYGPFSEIYGFAAVIMILFLPRIDLHIKLRELYLFFACAIVGSAYEFVCSFLQEAALGTVSWDYSSHPFNILGRTSLLYAFFWGIMGVLLIKNIYPLISRYVEKIPRKPGVAITWILLVFMILDLTISAMAVYRANERHRGIPASNVVQVQLDERYPDSVIKGVYPNMKHVDKIS